MEGRKKWREGKNGGSDLVVIESSVQMKEGRIELVMNNYSTRRERGGKEDL